MVWARQDKVKTKWWNDKDNGGARKRNIVENNVRKRQKKRMKMKNEGGMKKIRKDKKNNVENRVRYPWKKRIEKNEKWREIKNKKLKERSDKH